MKKNIGVIFGTIGTIVLIIIKVLFLINKEDNIILYGIKGYRTISIVHSILLIIFGLLLIVNAIKMLKNEKIEKQKEIENYNIMQENKRKEEEMTRQENSYLSATNRLSENVLRNHLQKSYTSDWIKLEQYLKPLYEQSKKMDTLQSKLKSLITKNDASVLDDTEDVLIEAEQGLLKNIRKVMNYMDVCDPNVLEESEKVKESAIQNFNENEKILDSVSDFLMSLTEYLNNQGSTDSLNTLNSYKDVLKDTISKE